ncbi:MAG: PRC-barrel domain-containing protein [Betaproteobacteria bacterium]
MPTHRSLDRPSLPAPMLVEGLLGQEIVDLDGRKIGELHDVVLDRTSGKIVYVFIALNQNKYADQRVMARWDALSVECGSRRLRMNTRAASDGSALSPESARLDDIASD